MKDSLLNFHHTISDAKNDQDSFEVLYTDFFTPIYKYVYYRVQDKETAMDIVQNVFLKAFVNKNHIRKDDALKYIYTIARNQLIDHLRKKHAVSFDEFEYFIEQTSDDSILNPENNSIVESNKSFVQKILETLSESQREIISLRYLQELEYAEIAAIVNKSEHSIRQVVSRTLRSLTEKYTNHNHYEN